PARFSAGRAKVDADAVEDAVKLVAAVLVGGPDGPERVELGEIAEAAVRGLGHGPFPAPVAAKALAGSDPEALRSFLAKMPRALSRRHRGEEESCGEANRTRRRR